MRALLILQRMLRPLLSSVHQTRWQAVLFALKCLSSPCSCPSRSPPAAGPRWSCASTPPSIMCPRRAAPRGRWTSRSGPLGRGGRGYRLLGALAPGPLLDRGGRRREAFRPVPQPPRAQAGQRSLRGRKGRAGKRRAGARRSPPSRRNGAGRGGREQAATRLAWPHRSPAAPPGSGPFRGRCPELERAAAEPRPAPLPAPRRGAAHPPVVRRAQRPEGGLLPGRPFHRPPERPGGGVDRLLSPGEGAAAGRGGARGGAGAGARQGAPSLLLCAPEGHGVLGAGGHGGPARRDDAPGTGPAPPPPPPPQAHEPDRPPPPPRAEAQPPRPSEHAEWVPGYWRWDGFAYGWIAGSWRIPEQDRAARPIVAAPAPPPPPQQPAPPPRTGWAWRPARGIIDPSGVRFEPGGWVPVR